MGQYSLVGPQLAHVFSPEAPHRLLSRFHAAWGTCKEVRGRGPTVHAGGVALCDTSRNDLSSRKASNSLLENKAVGLLPQAPMRAPSRLLTDKVSGATVGGGLSSTSSMS